MGTLKNNWKTLTKPFSTELNDSLQQQHHAAQFIAMIGRHLIQQQPDDSNTNLEFIPEKKLLLGNPLPNGMRVALQPTEMKLLILDKENNIKKPITLEGKTKKKIFDELTQNLVDLGVDVSNLKNELHYEIPEHELGKGAVFSVKNKSDFVENTNYRHNAKVVLNEIAPFFDQKEAIRIWPHHFDTGAFYTISRNKNGEPTQTIGIGLAIPDSMVNEPYYYLSFWSEKPIEGINNFGELKTGKWKMPDWNGAVLKLSEILEEGSATGQHDLVKTFYEDGIQVIMNILKR